MGKGRETTEGTVVPSFRGGVNSFTSYRGRSTSPSLTTCQSRGPFRCPMTEKSTIDLIGKGCD